MSGLFGILGISDTERAFAATIGQSVVYDAINQLMARYNAELDQALATFVEGQTEGFKERYKLPGGGRLQARGTKAPTAGVKAYGGYDVAYPLDDFGAALISDDITMAYMDIADLNRHLTTIFIQDKNTVRFSLLKALLNNAQDTFADPIHGSLTIEPLANGDTVTYPPVFGSESEATDDHYLESNYAASAISDTNNPLVTIRDELEEHFGPVQGNSNIAVFCNNAQRAKLEGLTDFDPVNDRYTQPGANTAQLLGLPGGMPGRVLGRSNGVWVIEWRWIPASYLIGVDMDSPKPLKMRVDPAYTGLPRGLALRSRDEQYPLEAAYYTHRFGLGAGNRLNGVVMELGTGGSYSIPSGYS